MPAQGGVPAAEDGGSSSSISDKFIIDEIPILWNNYERSEGRAYPA